MACEAELITKTILAMRGINQRKHKEAHDQGTLQLAQRPMAYKGTAHAWLRNLKGIRSQTIWTKEPALPDGPAPRQHELKVIACPACRAHQPTAALKLKGRLGFSQLTCQHCRDIRSTSEWLCMFGIQWHKCGEHVPRTATHCAKPNIFPTASS